MKNSIWETKCGLTNSQELSPITGASTNLVIDRKHLQPYPISPMRLVKDTIKSITGLGFQTPNLFYEKEIDFAFFPRPTATFLDKFYYDQGTVNSKNISGRIDFAKSRAMSELAEIMLNWIFNSSGIGE